MTTPDGGTIVLAARHAVVVCHRIRRRSSPTSTGLRGRAAVDQPRGDQRHGGARRASPSSAAAWSPPRWRRPTPGSARTVTLIVARRPAAPAWSRSPASCVAEALREQGVDRAARHRADARHAATATASRSRPRRRRRDRAPRRCWSRPAAPRAPRTSASRRSASNPGDWLDVDDTLPGPGLRLAVRRRRREPPRAAHPPGQVPGAGRGRRDRGPRERRAPSSDAPWGTHVATADHAAVPQVDFTDPEVASVGLTAAAAERGRLPRPRRRLRHRLGRGRRACTPTATAGTARMVVDEDREVAARRHLRRPGRRRAAAGGDDRDRRRGAARPALARRARLPDDQRDLAAPARDLRAAERRSEGRARARTRARRVTGRVALRDVPTAGRRLRRGGRRCLSSRTTRLVARSMRGVVARRLVGEADARGASPPRPCACSGWWTVVRLRAHPVRERDVVVADDREVVGHAQARGRARPRARRAPAGRCRRRSRSGGRSRSSSSRARVAAARDVEVAEADPARDRSAGPAEFIAER